MRSLHSPQTSIRLPHSGNSKEFNKTPSSGSTDLHLLPGLTVDYEIVDQADPKFAVSWVESFLLLGITSRDSGDPRYRALAKLKRLQRDHGLDDLKLVDFFVAAQLHSALLIRDNANGQSPTVEQQVDMRTKSCPNYEAYMDDIPDLDFIDEAAKRHQILRNPLFERGFLRTFRTERPGRGPVLKHLQSFPRYSSKIHSRADKCIRDGDGHHAVRSGARSIPPKLGYPSGSTTPPCIQPEHIQLLYHMLRHAESIYGLPLNMASAPRVSLTKLTDRAIICKRTGVANADLLLAMFTAAPFLPAHYVAIDRQIKAIVICVRGTATLFDSLTDVAATYDPISIRHDDPIYGNKLIDGLGHAGVLRSARNLVHKIRHKVLEAVGEFPDYEILVTGHSLGAATAAVLSLIMRNDPDLPRTKAICIAPPPCLSIELAEECNSNTITLVNGPDIVPRLTIKQALPFFATAKYVGGMTRARKMLLSAGWRRPVIKWEDLKAHNEKWIREKTQEHDLPELFLPGRVFQMVTKNQGGSKGGFFKRGDVEVIPVPRANFLKVEEQQKSMFFAHPPYNYRKTLMQALKSLGSEPVRLQSSSVLSSFLAIPASWLSPGSLPPEKPVREEWDGVLQSFSNRGMDLWPSLL